MHLNGLSAALQSFQGFPPKSRLLRKLSRARAVPKGEGKGSGCHTNSILVTSSFLVTTSKALVTSSDALVPSGLLFLLSF